MATHYRTYTGEIADAVGTYGYPVGIGYENGDRMEQLRKDFAKAKTREEELAITKQMGGHRLERPAKDRLRTVLPAPHPGRQDQWMSDIRGHPVGSPLYLNQWWGDADKRGEDPR